jgi:SAM-dependent methyltransferase
MPVHDWFDEETAATYDADEAAMFDPSVLDPVVTLLAGLAGDGPALELAIGTGRVALPLAARGVAVSGIDLSTAMVARLRAKPGGDEASIPVSIGDIATLRVPGAGTFSLVYLVFNTIGNLTTQDAQVDCFVNAAVHLRPGGCFVIETGVPALQRLPSGERLVPFDVSDTHIGIDEYDVVTQSLVSHHVTARNGTVSRASTPFRYAWPAELDLMARIAGMRLRARWADWSRTPFTHESRSHVSVWEKPATGVGP